LPPFPIRKSLIVSSIQWNRGKFENKWSTDQAQIFFVIKINLWDGFKRANGGRPPHQIYFIISKISTKFQELYTVTVINFRKFVQ
jgi:hypothetical protein